MNNIDKLLNSSTLEDRVLGQVFINEHKVNLLNTLDWTKQKNIGCAGELLVFNKEGVRDGQHRISVCDGQYLINNKMVNVELKTLGKNKASLQGQGTQSKYCLLLIILKDCVKLIYLTYKKVESLAKYDNYKKKNMLDKKTFIPYITKKNTLRTYYL